MSSASMATPRRHSKRARVLSCLVLCVAKTLAMIFGPLSPSVPPLNIELQAVKLVNTATYAGVIFTSTNRDILAEHYTKKALAAWRLPHSRSKRP